MKTLAYLKKKARGLAKNEVDKYLAESLVEIAYRLGKNNGRFPLPRGVKDEN